MPKLPHSIELHDSVLSEVLKEGGEVRLFLSPAYIHRDGKGWNQDVEVILREATMQGETPRFPATIEDGSMRTPLGPYHNLLNIPFAVDGPIELELELMSGKVLTIKGNGLAHEFRSEPVFIEEFPST